MTENSEFVIEATLLAVGGVGLVRMKTQFDTGIDDIWSALTKPEKLARWYGTFNGDFHVDGLFTVFIPSSGWNGRGRVAECNAPRHLSVSMWEKEGEEQDLTIDLVAVASHTNLVLEKGGIAPDLCWAYGAGWQAHLEDLADFLAGRERTDLSISWNMRFDEHEPIYRQMTVTTVAR